MPGPNGPHGIAAPLQQWFKPPRRNDDTGQGRPDARSDTEPEQRTEKPRVLCRQCRSVITEEQWAMDIRGSHRHCFANPHGLVFEIACFGDAPGCGTVGVPTYEFTWFTGFAWQIAVCRGCLTHLGWRFSGSGGQGFFGLIPERLIYPASP